MRTISKRSVVAWSSLAAAALLTIPAPATAHGQPHGPAQGLVHGLGHEFGRGHADHPVFVQTAEPDGNAIIAYERTRDGGLRKTGEYPTGGLGGVLDGAVADHLASQGSLTYDESTGLLYAVNAGSDTLTIFKVHGERLVRQQVVGSGGEFPVSVTAHGGTVYVLNARDGGSLQGFRFVGGRLVAVPEWHRELGYDASATPEFVSTVAQVSFSPSGRQLVVSTKLAGNSVLVYGVDRFGLSPTPVVNAVAAVPFGFVFDRAGNLVLTDAGAGTIATYRIGAGGALRLIDVEVTGGAAVCWVIGNHGYFYVSNTGSGTISRYQESGRGDLTKLGDVPTGDGPVDSAISSDGDYLYVQTGGDGGLDVFRIGRGGSLTKVTTVSVPGGEGGEGIAAL